MDEFKLYWIHNAVQYEEINSHRINVGYASVEEKSYPTVVEYALDLNVVTHLSSKINKEVVFTDKILAYEYIVKLNRIISDEISAACEGYTI